jgi:hypothetical protein
MSRKLQIALLLCLVLGCADGENGVEDSTAKPGNGRCPKCQPPPPPASDVATVAWDANKENDIAGYRVKYGFVAGLHGVIVDVGKVVSYTLGPFMPGQTLYVVVSAYDTRGNESKDSQEVFKAM